MRVDLPEALQTAGKRVKLVWGHSRGISEAFKAGLDMLERLEDDFGGRFIGKSRGIALGGLGRWGFAPADDVTANCVVAGVFAGKAVGLAHIARISRGSARRKLGGYVDDRWLSGCGWGA